MTVVNLDQVGPYRIEQLIGSGGMGSVYKAWDERLARWVAIKCVPASSHVSDENRERLRREARAVAGLKHAALAQVYDFLAEDGGEYFVMEYVEGLTLASLFLGGPLEVARAVDLARQIADALVVAGGAGVVHRDLKAENIMVTPAGKVKILDFGVAKRVDAEASEESLTQEGVVMGTTRAMSPEQAEGRRVDRRSDLFSLGSLLYEMLAGVHPFQHSSPLETMQRVVRHRPAALRQLNPRVPQPLERLVERLLEKDRELRPASAAEVVAELDRLTGDQGAAPLPALPTVVGGDLGSGWLKLPILIIAVAVVVMVVALFLML